jgi:hypothetical protein
MADDDRLRPAGGFAAAAAGVGIAAGPPRRFYVDSSELDAVLVHYRARMDPDGQVELMVIPDSVPAELRPGRGPVPKPVALADLLESDDARERYVGVRLAELSARQS